MSTLSDDAVGLTRKPSTRVRGSAIPATSLFRNHIECLTLTRGQAYTRGVCCMVPFFYPRRGPCPHFLTLIPLREICNPHLAAQPASTTRLLVQAL
eukprot:6212113-Pleurochrysis_carterae.AAC.5